MSLLIAITLFLGISLGVLIVVLVEVAGVLFLIRKLNRKNEEQRRKIAASSSSGANELDVSCYPNKQGYVWVLDKDMLPKPDKGAKPQKRKKEILEVLPARKYAQIKDQSLIIMDSDGSKTIIQLIGCTVAAVSATSLASRKWAKRYPIKVESKNSVVYHGSKSFYIYLDTSWEKESWCKALRLASCDNNEKVKWFAKLRSEFHGYLTSLNVEYPSFMKPSIAFNPETMDTSIKMDGSSSKVRHFLKKLAKKASKSGIEYKVNGPSVSGRGETRFNEKTFNNDVEENVPPQLSAFSHPGNRGQVPTSCDTDSVDKITDEGTLCWNLLVSRLFFDAKSNADIRSSVQARIQRTLSNMRIPSYIGEITCTGIDPGNLPPYIHGMRVLPSDMKEVVAMEIDIEYSGGAVLDIETRLEVRELDIPGSTSSNLESNSVGEVTSDLLEDFEYFGEQLKLSEGAVNTDQKGEDETKDSKSNVQASTNVSKWRSILNSVAKQVSQVPISLAIRVSALRGTLRFHIKPPPSDQLWFGFTSMPDIDFNLESSVGDHKVTSGHVALFLINRFKAAIRETMVLPNCESISIPFMLAEKDDWVPQKTAPFIWINHEASSDPPPVREVPRSQTSDKENLVHEACKVPTIMAAEDKQPEKSKKVECVQEVLSESSKDKSVNLFAHLPLNRSASASEELSTPLLGNDEHRESYQLSRENGDIYRSPNREKYQSLPRSLVLPEDMGIEGDDGRPKRMGTRARMLGLGKKMGEKLEEKRRNIEEKSRHIVEKMRGP